MANFYAHTNNLELFLTTYPPHPPSQKWPEKKKNYNWPEVSLIGIHVFFGAVEGFQNLVHVALSRKLYLKDQNNETKI